MRLFRILHWRAKSRFYRAKWERAEQTIAMLRRELNAEMWRNREREDTFVSAMVLGGRQMYGIPPRSGPALQAAPTPTVAPDPWSQFSVIEDMEFRSQWLPLAAQQGIGERQARQDFQNELMRRKQLNDEPFGVN